MKTFHLSRFGVFTLAVLLVSPGTSSGQNAEKIAQRELERRQAALPRGEEALVRGKSALRAKNFTRAHEEFRTAASLLPDAVTSGKAHDEAVDGFCKSGVKLAEQRMAEAKYADAEFILRECLDDRYDPNCRPAAELLAHLQQPGYFNRTMGPKFIAKVEDVKRLLSDADGYYNSGRYDLAFKKYEQVLALDPYNAAARRGEEKIDNTKYHYNKEAYNETRARQLWQVEKGWEEPVRQYGQAVSPLAEAFQRDVTGTARITNKLNTIIIPRVEFRDASIREAIDFLRQQAAANDPATEGRKGVDIVLRLTPLGQVAGPSIPVEPAPSPLTTASPETGAPPATPNPARRSAALHRQPGRFESEGRAVRGFDHSDQRAKRRSHYERISCSARIHQQHGERWRIGAQSARASGNGRGRNGQRYAGNHGWTSTRES